MGVALELLLQPMRIIMPTIDIWFPSDHEKLVLDKYFGPGITWEK